MPTRPRNLSIARAAPWPDASQLKRRLLVTGVSLALICVALLGALRVLHSFNSDTISAWRLVMLFANALFCVTSLVRSMRGAGSLDAGETSAFEDSCANRPWRTIMARIDERLQHRRASKTVAINLGARQRLAVRVITHSAVLAALAALVQIYDSVGGKGSLWNVFVSVGITAWWVTIAIYLSDRSGR
jgi:hypothetical protein